MLPGISVIICCYNSASRLKPTLEHLLAQKNILPSQWELIVVDNASKDGTAVFAQQFWESLDGVKPAFKIINQPIPGLSAAREMGIEQSAFQFVLCCDDDNWLSEHYLQVALKIMNSDSMIGVLGGKGSPVFEENEPPYFWQNQFHVLAVGDQASLEGDITESRGVVYGAGMVLNKRAYKLLKEKYDFQFQVTDRIGNSLSSSGDHELCLALKRIGFKILWSKDLKFNHFIPSARTNVAYYKRLFLGFGKSNAFLQFYLLNQQNIHSKKTDYKYICLRCIKNVILSSAKLLFTGYYFKADKYKELDEVHGLYENLGILNVMLKERNSIKNKFSNLPIFKANAGSTYQDK